MELAGAAERRQAKHAVRWPAPRRLRPCARAHAAPPRRLRRLLDDDHVVMLIPGGVQARSGAPLTRRLRTPSYAPSRCLCPQECLYMAQDRETIFLRKRFGFVKMALQTGAHLMPAFAFGQSRMCVQPRCVRSACHSRLDSSHSRLCRAALRTRGRGRRCFRHPRRGCCRDCWALLPCFSGAASARRCPMQCRCTWCLADPSACSKARAAPCAL